MVWVMQINSNFLTACTTLAVSLDCVIRLCGYRAPAVGIEMVRQMLEGLEKSFQLGAKPPVVALGLIRLRSLADQELEEGSKAEGILLGRMAETLETLMLVALMDEDEEFLTNVKMYAAMGGIA